MSERDEDDQMQHLVERAQEALRFVELALRFEDPNHLLHSGVRLSDLFHRINAIQSELKQVATN